MKHKLCEHCLVIPIAKGQKYCDACTEEVVAWLWLVEEQRLDDIEEQQYLAEVSRKHDNSRYYYEG
jgi:hypothetical protein